MNPLLEAYIKDIKIEAVKFQLQTSVPHSEIQHNDMMGKFDFTMLKSEKISKILGAEIRIVEDILKSYDYVNILAPVVKHWNDKRIEIQYVGYGNGDGGTARRTEAWCYVLLRRILKRKHKELYKLIKKRLTQV